MLVVLNNLTDCGADASVADVVLVDEAMGWKARSQGYTARVTDELGELEMEVLKLVEGGVSGVEEVGETTLGLPIFELIGKSKSQGYTGRTS